jgi:hypothetical protein
MGWLMKDGSAPLPPSWPGSTATTSPASGATDTPPETGAPPKGVIDPSDETTRYPPEGPRERPTAARFREPAAEPSKGVPKANTPPSPATNQ